MPCLISRNGIFYAVFSYHGKRVWRSTYSRDREEALQRMRDLSGEFISWKRITILDLRNELLKLLPGQLAPATLSAYDLALTHFSKVIGNKLLRTVSAYDIELFKSERLKQVSATTVAINFRTLKAAFSRATRLGMIERNPFEGVRNVVLPDREPVFLNSQEFGRLLQAIDNSQLRSIVIFAVCTSMRLGEILSLKWEENIDLERGYVHLKNRTDFIVKARRRRSVPLNGTAMNILSNLERRGEYVFPNAKGRRFLGNYISGQFKKYVRKAGLSEAIHFHTLRHTGASWLIQQDVPIAFVQRILGHSSIRTTEIYAHVTHEHLRQSVVTIDRIIGEV